MYSISYPADEHYKSAAAENGVQVIAKPRNLVNLYVLNVSAATVYLLVSDDAAGPHGLAVNKGTLYPILAAPGYVAIATHGGDQFYKGIYIGAYSTAALALAGGAPDGGASLLIKADFTASKIFPQ
jgi:hypothetical protein